MKGFEDLLGNFVNAQTGNLQVKIGLLVEWSATLEELCHFVLAGKQGAIDIPRATGEKQVDGGIQPDTCASLSNQRLVFWIAERSSSQGHDCMFLSAHLPKFLAFDLTKIGFSFAAEELAYRLALSLFDPPIKIDKVPSEKLRHAAPDSGFTGAHESNQIENGYVHRSLLD